VGGFWHGSQRMTGIASHTRANARRLRREMTPQERMVWFRLREVNSMLGTHFRRQAPVGRFIADFAEFGRKLIVEIDGAGHGGADDAARDDWFRAQGFAVLRIWNRDVDANPEGAMQLILDALGLDGSVPAPPSPPHKGEGGLPAVERSTSLPPVGRDGEGGR